MPLHPGARLGPYEIVSPLGAGGMGEVNRARDTKLGREVALKILPDLFAQDPDPSTSSGSSRAVSRDERPARFEREARTLAALNHPNIAHLYGVDDTSGVRALVMELVEGEDLSALIARGPAGSAFDSAQARKDPASMDVMNSPTMTSPTRLRPSFAPSRIGACCRPICRPC